MNAKTKILFTIIYSFILGVLVTSLAYGKLYGGRSSGEVAHLTERYNQLDREYTERQRQLESGIDQCLGYVERARTITERTGENASRAVANLREASDLIRAGIEEREALKMELSRLSASLHRLRGLDRVQAE